MLSFIAEKDDCQSNAALLLRYGVLEIMYFNGIKNNY